MNRSANLSTLITACFFALLWACPASASNRAFAKISIGGETIQGFSSQTTLGGVDLADYIELKSFEYEMLRPGDRGDLSVSPFKIRKYVDAATPLLAQALARGQTVEVELKVFDEGPDGSDRVLATFKLSGARLAAVRVWNAPVPGSGRELCEEVQIGYSTLTITHEPAPVTETEIDASGRISG